MGTTTGPVSSPNLTKVAVAQCEPRLIKGIELLEDQQRHRLAEIERRPADRAEQVAGIEFRNPRADAPEIGGGDHRRGLQRAGQAREIDAGIDVGGVGGADEDARATVVRRPARKVGGTKIGCVKLGAGDLGDAVDAAARRPRPGSSVRVPAASRAPRNPGSAAEARRDRLSAMPLAVTDLTNRVAKSACSQTPGRRRLGGASMLVRVGSCLLLVVVRSEVQCRGRDDDFHPRSYALLSRTP